MDSIYLTENETKMFTRLVLFCHGLIWSLVNSIDLGKYSPFPNLTRYVLVSQEKSSFPCFLKI